MKCVSFYEKLKPPRTTPCHECPKMLLFPSNKRMPGLDPRNALAVHLYGLASRDDRCGDSSILTNTLTIADAKVALDEYAIHFPTWLARQETLELMMTLNRVAVEVRGPLEEKARKDAMEKSRNEAKTRRR